MGFEDFEEFCAAMRSRSGLAWLTTWTELPSRMKLFNLNLAPLFRIKSGKASNTTGQSISQVDGDETSDVEDLHSNLSDSSLVTRLSDHSKKIEKMTENVSRNIEKRNSLSSSSTVVDSCSFPFPNTKRREEEKEQNKEDHFSNSTCPRSPYHLTEK